MPYAVGDLALERGYRVLDSEFWLKKRQDPEPSATESTPAETTPAETTSSAPTTSEAPPTTTSSAVETTTPVTTTPRPSVSTTPVTSAVPTDPEESSAVASQSAISTASEISTQSVASSAGSGGGSGLSTQIITSLITASGGAVSSVTVVVTSNIPATTSPASSNSDSTNVGAIVGGVVGGVGGLLLLIALFWFIRRKTKKDHYEENMFAPDRNVDRGELDLAGDDVHDPEAIARPYHLPPSPTRNEMSVSANSRPLSMQSMHSQGRPLSGTYDEAGMVRPTSGSSYYAQPTPGMGMPMPMPMSFDHLAYAQSRSHSTHDHGTLPSETTASDGGSSSARMLKEREARRLHVANDNGGVIVHSDGGRVEEEAEDSPQEIPPTYDSIGGPSGSQAR